MKIILRLFAAIILAYNLQSTAYSLEIQTGGATNISRTNCYLTATLVSTNATNAVITFFYGMADGLTNSTNWSYSAVYGAASDTGLVSQAISNLTPASLYYFRAYATETTNAAWGSGTSNFVTLAGAPTNTIGGVSNGYAMMANSNGFVLLPTNPAVSNLTIGGVTRVTWPTDATNLTPDILTISQRVDVAEGAITTNAAGIATNAANINTISQRVDVAEGAITTNAAGIATNAANINILGNRVTGVESNYLVKATNTPVSGYALYAAVGAGFTNLYWAPVSTNSGGTNIYSGLTNQLMDVNGVVWTITNAPPAVGTYAWGFNPANSTAWFIAESKLSLPYQAYSATVTPNGGGTCTIAYANGSLVKIIASTNITLTFDNTDFPTSGVSRVGVEIYAPTNSVAFATASITNATAPTISTSSWTSLFFRRTANETLWKGRQ